MHGKAETQIPTTPMESLVDMLTIALPWRKAHIHVEPLLLWKGETEVDSNGEHIPPPGHSQRSVGTPFPWTTQRKSLPFTRLLFPS